MTEAVRPIGAAPQREAEPKAGTTERKRAVPAPKTHQGPEQGHENARLLIEEVNGRFVYKVVDRESGEVLLQMPREQLVRVAQLPDYTSGSVLKVKV